MQLIRLGRTDLKVSAACLGTGGRSRLGLSHGGTFADAVRVVVAAIDGGVTFIDTAAAYDTEEVVAAAVRGRRDGLVVSTKSGIHRHEGDTGTKYISGSEYKQRVEESLRRLHADYVDILHIHSIKPSQYGYCVSEILPVMRELRDEGKIRFLGISESLRTDTTHEMLSRALPDGHFDVVMASLNLVNQTALSVVAPAAGRHDIGVQWMSAVRGRLATRATAAVLVEELIAAGEVDAGAVDRADPFGFLVGPGAAKSLPDACYRFNRHEPGVGAVLTGTGSRAHLAENLRSVSDGRLPAPGVARLRAIFGKVRSVPGD